MVDIDFQNSLLVISLHYIGDIISFGGKITHFILYIQISSLTIPHIGRIVRNYFIPKAMPIMNLS